MSLPVVLLRAARSEFDEAAASYEQRRPGLGSKFTVAVRNVLQHIGEHPQLYPHEFEDIRPALVSGYPYCVHYRIEENRIVEIAVFHTARDPAVWQGRA